MDSDRRRHQRPERSQAEIEAAKQEFEERRKNRAYNARWILAFIIWGIGAAGLWWLWEWQKTVRGTKGDLIAYVIYFVSFWYPLSIAYIRDRVGYWLGD